MATVAGALSVSACGLILGLEAPSPLDRPAPGDEPTEAAVDSGDPCVHIRPPAPAGDDDPATELPPLWLAMTSLRSLAEVDGSIAGFDIDDACTCGADRRGGAAPCWTEGPTPSICDADGGVDNALGRIGANLAGAFDISAYATKDIARGRRTSLVWLAGYNGKANDAKVKAAVVISDGLYSDLGCDGGARSIPNEAGCAPGSTDGRCTDGGIFPPVWDGCDRWHPRSDSVKFPDGTPQGVMDAYVSNYQLVVRFGSFTIFGAGQGISVSEAIFVGRLVQTPAFEMRDGRIVGRIPLKDAARALGQTLAGTSALCNDKTLWTFAKTTMCGALDTMESPSRDFAGARCDSFSFTLGFAASPAAIDDRGTVKALEDEPAANCEIAPTVPEFCAPSNGGTDGGVDAD